VGYAVGPISPFPSDRLSYSVRLAASGSEMRRAAGLHWSMNRGDRYWTPPSRRKRQKALSSRHNPALAAETMAVFIAEGQSAFRPDYLIGSIAVWTAEDSELGPVARFGFFDVVNDCEVAEALFDAAESWLQTQSPVRAIRGPYCLAGEQAPGLLTDGFNVRGAAHLPYNPPYYPDMLAGAGYAPCRADRTYLLAASAAANPMPVRLVRLSPGPEDPQTLNDEQLPLAASCLDAATSGVIRFGIVWEEAGEVLDSLVVIQASRLAGSKLAGRLLRPWFRRLYACPATATARLPRSDRRLALYRAAAGAAADQGFAEVLVGPIPEEAESDAWALAELGARRAHTFQVFEKAF